MKNLPRLFGNTVEIPFETPVSPDRDKIHAIEEHLAAAGRFKEHFGITVDSVFLANTLTAASNQEMLAGRLGARDIGILDSRAVAKYQNKRTRPTILERYTRGCKPISEWFEEHLMHGVFGAISAFIALLVTLPLGIPAIIDLTWYNVNFLESYFAILLPFGVITMVVGEGEYEEFGKAYAFINYWVLGLPVRIITCLFAPWLMKIDMGREWKQVSVRELLGAKTSWQGPIEVLDAVAQAIPDEKLMFEVLEDADGTRDKEVFLGVQIKGTEGGLLYVWHGQV